MTKLLLVFVDQCGHQGDEMDYYDYKNVTLKLFTTQFLVYQHLFTNNLTQLALPCDSHSRMAFMLWLEKIEDFNFQFLAFVPSECDNFC